jgi:pyridoxamine 5'-phosphate oxidase
MDHQPFKKQFVDSEEQRLVMMENPMQQFRKEYVSQTLTESNAADDPLKQFNIWLQEAVDANISEPNAMVLATASPDGMPSIRMVLLKGLENGSFVFFTNYNSRKGIHLSNNPKGSLLFFWSELERQIRIEGFVERTDPEYSDAYFLSRPFESRAGAIASRQSARLKSREVLEKEFQEILAGKDGNLVRPEYWGGYALKPVLFEFWQGREHRLHDRIQYRLNDSQWYKERLAP